ncbi:MAG: hypothetical protein L6V93_18890 [Clostridiales bacterium]|nr:MAG: hypothetical protein L6V93_18890 [Clostridiales bacterium]
MFVSTTLIGSQKYGRTGGGNVVHNAGDCAFVFAFERNNVAVAAKGYKLFLKVLLVRRRRDDFFAEYL